jgi:hypothetical protein
MMSLIHLQEDWQKFLPVIRCPKDRPLTKYGEGDGSKLLCNTQGLPNKPDGSPCIIYSLGSNGESRGGTGSVCHAVACLAASLLGASNSEHQLHMAV